MNAPSGIPRAAIVVQIAQHLTDPLAYGPERAAVPGAVVPVRSPAIPARDRQVFAHDCPSVLPKTENHIWHRLARMFAADY